MQHICNVKFSNLNMVKKNISVRFEYTFEQYCDNTDNCENLGHYIVILNFHTTVVTL